MHTIHSGPCTHLFFRRFCLESYNQPAAVYETLKRQGMSLVTVTDHDSIGAVEELRRHPDFFLSEEVTCTTPEGTRLHMGVYDITERDHTAIQRLRDDLPALLALLGERDILHSINHPFSSLTGLRTEDDFAMFREYFPAVETHNGHMLPGVNRAAAEFAARAGKVLVAGSDSHAAGSVGSTYTEVPGARTKREFFEGLRRGLGQAHGENGTYRKLTRDVFWIGRQMTHARPWTRILLPLALLLPAVTLGHYLKESIFAWYWVRKLNPTGASLLPAPLEMVE